jgi:hypothetical protein
VLPTGFKRAGWYRYGYVRIVKGSVVCGPASTIDQAKLEVSGNP